MKYTGVIVAVLSALVCRLFLVSVYKVPGPSMAPTIIQGDYVLASQIAYGLKSPMNSRDIFWSTKPQTGQLVIYTKFGKSFIKRVVAVEGDEIDYSSAELELNAQKCKYDSVRDIGDGKNEFSTEECSGRKFDILRPMQKEVNSQNIAKTKLVQGQILVAGDNRSFENNPNSVEIINSDQIVGKPLLIWMSYSSTQDFISKTLGFKWNRILTILN